jgi:hypothetical protein
MIGKREAEAYDARHPGVAQANADYDEVVKRSASWFEL